MARTIVTIGPRHWLIVVLLLGGGLRFFPIWFGLPYLLARPDEELLVSIATRMQAGDLHPRFFHWPSLTFYAFAGLYTVASAVRDDASIGVAERILIGRAAIALAGTLTILVLFSMARRIADATTGLLSALFLAVAILHVRESHFAMADVLMTFLVTAALALLIRAVDEAGGTPTTIPRTVRLFGASGLIAGLAASTKYNAAALLTAMMVAQLILLVRFRGRPRSVVTWVPFLAFLVAFGLGFVAGSPYALIDFPRFAADLRYDLSRLSGGHAIHLGRGWIYHLERSLPYGVGLPIFMAAAVGVVPMARHHAQHALVLAGLCVPFYLVIGSGTTVFFRYVLPLVPIACLLASVGVRHMGSWLAAHTRLSLRATVLLLAALVAGPGFVNSVWFDVLLARTDSRVLAARWLLPRLEPEHTMCDAGGLYTRLDLPHAPLNEWQCNPDENSFGHREGRIPDWLVLSESPVSYYASIPQQLRPLAQERYDLVLTVPATKGDARAAVYDLQDAFFKLLSRFDTIERPGPTVRIYRRKAAPPVGVSEEE